MSSSTVSALECYWGLGEEVPDEIKTCKPEEGQDVCILHFVEGDVLMLNQTHIIAASF